MENIAMVRTDKAILIRVTPEMKATLERLAAEESRSLSNYVALVLKAHLAAIQKGMAK